MTERRPRRVVHVWDFVRRNLGDERLLFVVVSLLVNLLLLARSYVTMRVLDYRDLGLAALMQSIVALVGILQFGFLNGGFRLLCEADAAEAQRVNNLVYGFLAILSGVMLVGALAILPFVSSAGSDLIAALGIVGGIFTLIRTWMMSQLIAGRRLRTANRVNFWSAVASLATLVAIPLDPLFACLAAVVVQPAMFALLCGLGDRSLLPSGLVFDRTMLRAVMRAGFAVFLTGMLVQLNLQIERWYVTGVLGLEALGHLYLAFLFVTLFQLVPTSFDQVFLPGAVRAHADGRPDLLRRTIGQYFLVALAYCAAAAFVVATLAAPVTRLVLPQYAADLRYVYILLPGLVVFTLSSSIAILFNVLVRYRFYLVAYGGATVVTAAAFALPWGMGHALGLNGAMIVRDAAYAFTALVVLIGFVRLAPAAGLRHGQLAGDAA